MDSILEDKELKRKHVDLQKRFPKNQVYPKCLAALLCGAAIRMKASTVPSGKGCLGNNIGRLVTWECPLRTDSASWKSLESFIQFTSFCSSCNLPDNSIIVFWSSMSFRLASVSKVELWNFRNSSISVRILLMELHENPFADAIILLVEFDDLVLLELLGVRDEKLSRSILR